LNFNVSVDGWFYHFTERLVGMSVCRTYQQTAIRTLHKQKAGATRRLLQPCMLFVSHQPITAPHTTTSINSSFQLRRRYYQQPPYITCQRDTNKTQKNELEYLTGPGSRKRCYQMLRCVVNMPVPMRYLYHLEAISYGLCLPKRWHPQLWYGINMLVPVRWSSKTSTCISVKA
jgi:hypothetical protein